MSCPLGFPKGAFKLQEEMSYTYGFGLQVLTEIEPNIIIKDKDDKIKKQNITNKEDILTLKETDYIKVDIYTEDNRCYLLLLSLMEGCDGINNFYDRPNAVKRLHEYIKDKEHLISITEHLRTLLKEV